MGCLLDWFRLVYHQAWHSAYKSQSVGLLLEILCFAQCFGFKVISAMLAFAAGSSFCPVFSLRGLLKFFVRSNVLVAAGVGLLS